MMNDEDDSRPWYLFSQWRLLFSALCDSYPTRNRHLFNRYLKLAWSIKCKDVKRKSKGTQEHHIFPKNINGAGAKWHGADDLDNLVVCSDREHFLLHKILWKALPENASMNHAFFRMHKKFPGKITSREHEKLMMEFRLGHSAIMKKYYKDPVNRKANSDRQNRPEVRKVKSDRMKVVKKDFYKDPFNRESQSEKMKEVYKDPEHLSNSSAIIRVSCIFCKKETSLIRLGYHKTCEPVNDLESHFN